MLCPEDGRMRPLAFAGRVGVMDKAALIDRLQHPHNAVVHHAVAKISNRDEALLGIPHLKMPVRPRPVYALLQLLLQLQQFLLEPKAKGTYLHALARAAPRPVVSLQQAVKTHRLLKQSAHAPHGLLIFIQPPIMPPKVNSAPLMYSYWRMLI